MRLRPIHVDLGDVLVQVFAVALGVVIGFAVTSWSEQLRQRDLQRATVRTIVAELRSNQVGMRTVLTEHQKVAASLTALVVQSKRSMSIKERQAAKVLRATGFPTNIPLSIAWQIAQSDQGLTLLPFEDRYDLAWVYQLQTVYYERQQRYVDSLLTLTEPANGNYYFEVLDLSNQAVAVVSAERQLDTLYTAALRRANRLLPT